MSKVNFELGGDFSPVKTNIPTPNEQIIWIWKFTAILPRGFLTEYLKGCSVTSETRHDLSEGTWKKLQMFWRWRQIYELGYLFRTSGSKPLMPVFWIESLAQPFEKQALLDLLSTTTTTPSVRNLANPTWNFNRQLIGGSHSSSTDLIEQINQRNTQQPFEQWNSLPFSHLPFWDQSRPLCPNRFKPSLLLSKLALPLFLLVHQIPQPRIFHTEKPLVNSAERSTATMTG